MLPATHDICPKYNTTPTDNQLSEKKDYRVQTLFLSTRDNWPQTTCGSLSNNQKKGRHQNTKGFDFIYKFQRNYT